MNKSETLRQRSALSTETVLGLLLCDALLRRRDDLGGRTGYPGLGKV